MRTLAIAARIFMLSLPFCAGIPVSLAQNYPIKSIRVVAPSAPGGGVDFIARSVARKLTLFLEQSVVVDNRAGAGGNPGTEIVAKSQPDGYTLLVVPSAFAINPSLYKKVPYDPVQDFDPFSILTSYVLILVVHPSLPVYSVKDLLALARAKPATLNVASSGSGTTTHLGAELFKHVTGVKMTHIPYRGNGPAFTDLLGGQVELMFSSPVAVPYIKGGKLRPIGVTGTKRLTVLPDVPTIAEAAVPGYEVSSWNAMFAPKGTPAAVIKRLNAETNKALTSPDMAELLSAQALEPIGGPPEDLGRLVASEMVKWAKVIKAAGMRAD